MTGIIDSMAMTTPDQGKYISAGDLEKFSYCPLSWWLSKEHDPSNDALKKGITQHEELGQSLWKIDVGEKTAKESERMVFWYAVVATLIAITGLGLLPFDEAVSISEIMGVVALIWILAASFFLFKASRSTMQSKLVDYEKIILVFAIVAVVIALNAVAFIQSSREMAQILELVAIIWLIGASYFLYRSLVSTNIVSTLRDEFRVKGKIEYIDVDNSKVFRSERYGLSGRPDYIIKLAGHLIPVEEKKGRTPRGPLFSHVLQIVAYCLLIEETEKKAPPYGLLKYPEREDEIEYNEDQKNLLVQKLGEMRQIMKTGEAHRNHNRPGKCTNCSRRDVCTEKLT
ncbi:MAG: CRISPR-associated protein Cas4 [Thermoplasmata archaeon]|nr:CRISPR-associated protein Cas4 [Thermoplasmata archaeon]